MEQARSRITRIDAAGDHRSLQCIRHRRITARLPTQIIGYGSDMQARYESNTAHRLRFARAIRTTEFETTSGSSGEIAVTGAVDIDLGLPSFAPRLGLGNHGGNAGIVAHHGADPGVQAHPHAGLQAHLIKQVLGAFDVVAALARVAARPWLGSETCRQFGHQAGLVATINDPRQQATGPDAAETASVFDQLHVSTGARRRDGSSDAGRPTTTHHHINCACHWDGGRWH